jgi:hypothetical protein
MEIQEEIVRPVPPKQIVKMLILIAVLDAYITTQ